MNKQQTACLLCGSEKLRELSRYAEHGLLKCDNCSFIFCRDIPTTEELIRHYETYPRNDDISAITIKRYNEISQSFNRFRKTENWIDVGCGNGHLLATAKKNNWKVYGTEFTDFAVKICRDKGIEMNQGVLDVKNYQEGQFDIITFIEVLEHINNPHEEIEKFNTLLRKGGALYITTPNFNALSRYMLKEKWNIIEYPEHLSYYTPKTIHQLLTKHGFRKIKLTTSGFSPARMGKAMQKNPGVIPKVNEEQIRQMTESNFAAKAVKNIINNLLGLTDKGDTIKALYYKY